jgi:hypothetical protein
MIDWINGAPPAELAAELMAAFDPNVPRRVSYLDATDFSDWMFRGYPKRRGLLSGRPMHEPILEALQVLEHSELVYVRIITDSRGRRWQATRLGLATLASGKNAVRQRIKDRTGL